MHIKKICHKDPSIDHFIREKESEYEEWEEFSEGMINWEFVKENIIENSDVLALFTNNKIETLCLITKSPDSKEANFLPNWYVYSNVVDSLSSPQQNQQIEILLHYIKEKYPAIVLDWSNYHKELESSGFELLKFPYESENRRGYYHFFDFNPYVFTNQTDLIDAFYNSKQKREIKKMLVETLSAAELKKEIYDNNFISSISIYNDSNQLFFDGFDYFSPRDLQSSYLAKNTQFVIASVLEAYKGKTRKRIVGVMKTAEYTNAYSDYTGINYIDVHHYYRRLGISKLIYKELNNSLTDKDLVIGSMLSQMGKKTKINELRNRLVVNCPVFDSNEEFYHFKKAD